VSDIFLTPTRTAGGLSLEWSVRGVLPTEMARRLPAAASLAMNATALEAVDVVRRETPKNFTQRGAQSREFFRQSFQVTKFSRRSDLEIAFGTSRGLLEGRSSMLLDHEDGSDRVARGRNDFPYIPVIGSSLRRTKNDLLPRWAYPKALGLVQSGYLADGFEAGQDRTPGRRGAKRGIRAQENRKGFILRNREGDPVGIFRRVPLAGARVSPVREGGKKLTLRQRRRRGTGQSTLELLFATPKVIQIKPRLGFRRLADHVMLDRIQVNFAGMLGALTSDQVSGLSAFGLDQLNRYRNPRQR
jgi:hypothetical protein